MKFLIPILAACLLPLTSAATGRYFVQINGSKQGDILRSTLRGFETAAPARGINLTISTLTDGAAGQAIGKRHYAPVSITRDIDDRSPLVIRALTTNELLKSIKVMVQQVGNNGASGSFTTVRTYEFTNAQLVGVQHVSGLDDLVEVLTFKFQKWELKSTVGGITVGDDITRL
ncbi:hypothetical protein TWF696_003715 [Orbilia brochopaga]|uniref:Uncharacterized protein n=1 Tax=Orbilia brochopaga TaxID=3140254 RepID=A0AAV9V495_9PEZI